MRSNQVESAERAASGTPGSHGALVAGPPLVGLGSWLCGNHSAGRSGARLIRIECRSRIKDSPRPQVRFFSCARTTASPVFTQPGSWAAVRVTSVHRPLSVRELPSRRTAANGREVPVPVIHAMLWRLSDRPVLHDDDVDGRPSLVSSEGGKIDFELIDAIESLRWLWRARRQKNKRRGRARPVRITPWIRLAHPDVHTARCQQHSMRRDRQQRPRASKRFNDTLALAAATAVWIAGRLRLRPPRRGSPPSSIPTVQPREPARWRILRVRDGRAAHNDLVQDRKQPKPGPYDRPTIELEWRHLKAPAQPQHYSHCASGCQFALAGCGKTICGQRQCEIDSWPQGGRHD